jgi:hypothetical protein
LLELFTVIWQSNLPSGRKNGDGTIKELICYGQRSELCKLTKQIVATHGELPSCIVGTAGEVPGSSDCLFVFSYLTGNDIAAGLLKEPNFRAQTQRVPHSIIRRANSTHYKEKKTFIPNFFIVLKVNIYILKYVL